MRKVLVSLATVSIAIIMSLSFAFAADQAAPAPKAEAKAKVELIDINSATEEQLTGLGLSKEIAKKIIAARPYAKKDQLTSKKILTADEYKKVSDKIVAKQAPKTAATTAAAPAPKK